MKNRIAALPLLLALFCSGCYDDYVEDYDHSGVYVAYQYDLRSFIVGEEMSFELVIESRAFARTEVGVYCRAIVY